MIKPRLLILSVLIMLTIAPLQNASAHNINRTYGFIVGQRLMLNRIEAEFPALSLRAKKAELEFESAFGIAEKNIERALREQLKDKYSEYVAAGEKLLKSTIISQQISIKIAARFLDEVESRAKGEIPSPILETLLKYQFESRPAEELNRGFKRIYRTKGHPKAKRLNLQIEYPRSWSSREGNRPNVIQYFSNSNGRGTVAALIMIKYLVKEAQGGLTREEITALKTLEGSKEVVSALFSDSSVREMARASGMSNVRDITTKKILLDGWPGVMLEFIGDGQRLDIMMTTYERMYIAIYKNYMIFLQFNVTKLPGDTERDLKARFSKFAPLFHLIANSLVIQSQY